MDTRKSSFNPALTKGLQVVPAQVGMRVYRFMQPGIGTVVKVSRVEDKIKVKWGHGLARWYPAYQFEAANPLTNSEKKAIKDWSNIQYAISQRYKGTDPVRSEFYHGRSVAAGKIAATYNPVKSVAKHHNNHHMLTTRNAIIIGAGAGIISALLPSVPTIVKFWNDETPVSFLGIRTTYDKFLRVWVAGSAIALTALFLRFRK